MPRSFSLVLALLATGCSLVFAPSQYTGGRDASQHDASMDAAVPPDAADASGPRDGGTDAGGSDAAGFDGGASDASASDASASDAEVSTDAGGLPNAWPACGDSVRQSSGATDRGGMPITISDALHQALFETGTAADGEVALRGDVEVPRPATGRYVDVAMARRTGGGAYVAGATDVGQLLVHTIDLTMSLVISAPLTVSWHDGEAPDSIERIAMRTIGSTTVLAVVGTRSAAPLVRGWRCTVTSTVNCGAPFSQAAPGQLATAAVAASSGAGTSDVLFVGPSDAMQASDGSIRSHALTLSERVSGSDGQLVFTRAESGSPFGFWISSAGEVPYRIGPDTTGLGSVAFAGDHFLMLRAINDAPGPGFELGARVLQCSAAACTCPGADGSSCMNATGFSSLLVDGLDARFVEAERAGGAVLAIVGAGRGALSTRGTDVRLFAFDAMSGAALDATSPGIVLGSGVSDAPPIGTLVPDFGMRAAVVPITAGFDVVQAALVDLNEGGSTSRRIYASALRICERW